MYSSKFKCTLRKTLPNVCSKIALHIFFGQTKRCLERARAYRKHL